MIDVYYWPTPNGHKVTIFLEELRLNYKVIPINIGKGDQFAPEFLKISPNNKMPAIVDHDGPGGAPISIFESGEILLYLAEKTGCFMPDDIRGRYKVIEWLMFQMASVGPMLGQAHHFRRAAPEHFCAVACSSAFCSTVLRPPSSWRHTGTKPEYSDIAIRASP